MSVRRDIANEPSNGDETTLSALVIQALEVVKHFSARLKRLGFKGKSGGFPVLKVTLDNVLVLMDLHTEAVRRMQTVDDHLRSVTGGLVGGPQGLREDRSDALDLIRRGLSDLRILTPPQKKFTSDELKERMRLRLKSGKPLGDDPKVYRSVYGTVHNPEQLKLIDRGVEILESVFTVPVPEALSERQDPATKPSMPGGIGEPDLILAKIPPLDKNNGEWVTAVAVAGAGRALKLDSNENELSDKEAKKAVVALKSARKQTRAKERSPSGDVGIDQKDRWFCADPDDRKVFWYFKSTTDGKLV